MKRASWILAIAVLGIFSCEKEEYISDRGYPFLESISVSDLDETGVTVNFEVLKYGGSGITEHGVEFIEAHKLDYSGDERTFDRVTKSGSPGSSLVSFRISYDLIDGRNYVARPYVKSGSTVVYGENLVFESQGVSPPIINEVSDSVLTQSHVLTISGDYFNKSLEYLEVMIPGLEGIFSVDILEHSSSQIKIKVWLQAYYYTIPAGKFDLVVKSGGKTTALADFFSVILPKVEDISTREVKVGQYFDASFNRLTSLENLEFRLATSDGGYYFGSPAEIGTNTVRFRVENMPPGEYTLSVVGRGFSNEFSEKIRLVNSWEPFKDQFPISSLYNWNWIGVGDQMLFWKNEIGDFQKFYSLPLESDVLEPLPEMPSNAIFRSYYLTQVVQNRYLYYGLGITYNQPGLKDLNKFDIQTKRWVRLKDFPFGQSEIEKSFYFRGKIYVILLGVSNFAVYDTVLDSWSMTTFEVPDDLRMTLYQDANEDGVYYVPREQNKLVKYIPGVSREEVVDVPGYSSGGNHLVKIIGEEVFLFHGVYEYYRVNLSSKEVFPVQTFNGQQYIKATPWVTSKGLMLAFPTEQHAVEMKVYRWVAGD